MVDSLESELLCSHVSVRGILVHVTDLDQFFIQLELEMAKWEPEVFIVANCRYLLQVENSSACLESGCDRTAHR